MLKKYLLLLLALIYSLSLSSCDNAALSQKKPAQESGELSALQKIKQAGVLRVATKEDPTSYYPVAGGYAGLEYDLVMLFAEQLGVKVEFQTSADTDELLDKVRRAEADIVAANVSVTVNRQKIIRFAPAYQSIFEQVIYRSGASPPKVPTDLNNGILEIIKNSSYLESLEALKQNNLPTLNWLVNEDIDTKELLRLVDAGLIDYTIADSNQALLMRRFYPKLNIAFNIGQPRQIAWGLPLSDDDSLYNEVSAFFQRIKKDKSLDQLLERYYAHADTLDYVDKCKFYQRQKNRLPVYKHYFIQAAKKYGLDWRLLAAIGYQESHWAEDAISPTGVRGIMMLTNDTAKQVGILDRGDPFQSINGGAMYFQQRLAKIPAQIPQPDRIWFALASYNVGFGHLEDARTLTAKQGGNPDKWIDVKERLPLLSEEQWFSQTKFGYARGHEPVDYVENVRNYYDLLVWLNTDKNPPAKIDTSETTLTTLLEVLVQQINSSYIAKIGFN